VEDLSVDGRIILKCNFGKRDGKEWTGLIWLRIVKAVNLPSGSKNCGEFFD